MNFLWKMLSPVNMNYPLYSKVAKVVLGKPTSE